MTIDVSESARRNHRVMAGKAAGINLSYNGNTFNADSQKLTMDMPLEVDPFEEVLPTTFMVSFDVVDGGQSIE